MGAMFLCLYFLPVESKFFLGKRALEKGARVNARGGMRLEIDQVAAEGVGAGTEKMVEADFEQVGRGRIAGDMAAQFAIGAIRPHHHCQCIPPHQAGNAFLDGQGV